MQIELKRLGLLASIMKLPRRSSWIQGAKIFRMHHRDDEENLQSANRYNGQCLPLGECALCDVM
jgi:hypothetical protein